MLLSLPASTAQIFCPLEGVLSSAGHNHGNSHDHGRTVFNEVHDGVRALPPPLSPLSSVYQELPLRITKTIGGDRAFGLKSSAILLGVDGHNC